MKNKKQHQKIREMQNIKPLFCTTCNKELNIFWLMPQSTDPEAIRKNHEECVKAGRFNGEFCSKMFIAGEYEIEEILEKKKSAGLKTKKKQNTPQKKKK
ncbi:MAG: hypothetical protein ACP5P3_10620 [Ignavibacteria bacterium]